MQILSIIVYLSSRLVVTESCNVGEFRCDDGACVPLYNKCDDSFECADYSDELYCYIENQRCPEAGYRCPDGLCYGRKEDCPISTSLPSETMSKTPTSPESLPPYASVYSTEDYLIYSSSLSPSVNVVENTALPNKLFTSIERQQILSTAYISTQISNTEYNRLDEDKFLETLPTNDGKLKSSDHYSSEINLPPKIQSTTKNMFDHKYSIRSTQVLPQVSSDFPSHMEIETDMRGSYIASIASSSSNSLIYLSISSMTSKCDLSYKLNFVPSFESTRETTYTESSIIKRDPLIYNLPASNTGFLRTTPPLAENTNLNNSSPVLLGNYVRNNNTRFVKTTTTHTHTSNAKDLTFSNINSKKAPSDKLSSTKDIQGSQITSIPSSARLTTETDDMTTQSSVEFLPKAGESFPYWIVAVVGALFLIMVLYGIIYKLYLRRKNGKVEFDKEAEMTKTSSFSKCLDEKH